MATSSGQSSCEHPRILGPLLGACLGAVVLLGGIGCQSGPSGQVQSYLSGKITVATTGEEGDNSGFRILVVHAEGRDIDTLGTAVTEQDGSFELTVTAPQRGVYPLMIWGQQGRRRLARTDYVVVDGDSGVLRVEVPLEGRDVQIRSDENVAFETYRSTLAQHRRALGKRLEAETVDTNALSHSVRQTSSMLWSLQNTFPGTYASHLGATESLSLLAGWKDSLVVERARSIEPSSPRFVAAARIARRAAARLSGQKAVLDLLDSFESRAVTDAQRAGIQSIRIRAFIDSQKSEAALSAAQRLRNRYPDTRWADWAKRALYEVHNLAPGMKAPNLTARTVDGDTISLRSRFGHPVVLEYFRPGDALYHRQFPTRSMLYKHTRPDSVTFLSISVEPDTLLYEAFARKRFFPGHKIIAPRGMDDPLVETYNVVDSPTRFLIGPTGRLVGRYTGPQFFSFQQALTRLLRRNH